MKLPRQSGRFDVRQITILAAALVFFGIQPSVSKAYDDSKFCNKESATAVVFIDVTTKFDERSKSLFQDGISKILDHLSGGQKVVIFTIEDAFSTSRRLYEGCVPFCPSEGTWDWLLSDCTGGYVKLKTREQKIAIATALRGRLNQTADLNGSEIIRTLAFTMDALSGNDKKVEVFIFSDMIENSEFMPGKLFWSQPVKASLLQIRENRLLPNMQNATVKVFGVGRGGDINRKPLAQALLNKLKAFWEAYFKEAGVGEVHIAESMVIE